MEYENATCQGGSGERTELLQCARFWTIIYDVEDRTTRSAPENHKTLL